MKILLLIESLTSGGRERRLIELLKGSKQYSGIELGLVVFSDRIHYEEVYDLGVPITILKRVPKKNPMVFYRLFNLCKKWKPDLLHSWGSMSTILAIPSSKLLGIPLINGSIVDAPENLSFRNKDYFRTKLAIPFSKVIVGNSLAGLRAYKIPTKKGLCIYNGFDLNRISELKNESKVRREFNITTPKIVGMVGNFSERKDFKTYIKAAMIVLNQRDDVTFLAIGEGPDLGECKKMVADEHMSKIIFTGLQRDVESIVAIFNLGVLATNMKVHGEGISNAILEYMALSKATVATIGGGSNEAVGEGETGFLVVPASPEAMANKISLLLSKEDLCETMGVAARNRMENMFGLKKMTDSYVKLYKESLL
ncbi:glycosyltransferase [uncultured Zobellia sp.]|uniref:glycosyltransferase n=1 Tax=uncultured Zobellia sp. TaxID=255433 RepID=UPI002595A424|nr:glycosyltransferase [uncultured Zobellia sp.]